MCTYRGGICRGRTFRKMKMNHFKNHTLIVQNLEVGIEQWFVRD